MIANAAERMTRFRPATAVPITTSLGYGPIRINAIAIAYEMTPITRRMPRYEPTMSPAASPSTAMRSRRTIRLRRRSAMKPMIPSSEKMTWYRPNASLDSSRTTMSVAIHASAATT